MKYNASILTVGCSAQGGNHLPALERDALYTAECFQSAHSRFPNEINYPDYPVRKWQSDILVGQVINYHDFYARLADMPVRETMMLYISSHGFTLKDDKGKTHYCLWFGDKENWITTYYLFKQINKICENPKVKHFQIVIDACFSGLAKKDLRIKSGQHSKMFEHNAKSWLQSKVIKPRGVKLPKGQKVVKPHKKISLLNVCKGKQTSFASFSPSDMAPVTTYGHSLGTNAWLTAMNWYYSYAPGLNLMIKGFACKPRSTKAIMTLAQRRVDETIKTIALREWLEEYPPTVIQKFNHKGKLIFY